MFVMPARDQALCSVGQVVDECAMTTPGLVYDTEYSAHGHHLFVIYTNASIITGR